MDVPRANAERPAGGRRRRAQGPGVRHRRLQVRRRTGRHGRGLRSRERPLGDSHAPARAHAPCRRGRRGRPALRRRRLWGRPPERDGAAHRVRVRRGAKFVGDARTAAPGARRACDGRPRRPSACGGRGGRRQQHCARSVRSRSRSLERRAADADRARSPHGSGVPGAALGDRRADVVHGNPVHDRRDLRSGDGRVVDGLATPGRARGAGRGGAGRPALCLRRRGAVPHLQRQRDVRGGRPAMDRQGPDAHAESRHRRGGGRQQDLRPRRRHAARPGGNRRQRGVHAVIRRGLVLVAVAVALAAPGARTLSAAESPREEALAALADTRDVDNRRRGAVALAETGVMADVPKLAAALRDDDPLVRKLAERSMWQVWSRSGDAAVDRLLASGIEQMSAREGELAVQTFTEVIRRRPDFAEGWNKRATVYYLMGEYQKSLADCDEVMKRNPYHFGALSGYGMIYLQLDEPAKALDYFQRALTVNPNLESINETVEMLKPLLIQRRKDTI